MQIENFSQELLDAIEEAEFQSYFSVDGTIPYIVGYYDEEQPFFCARLHSENNKWIWKIDNSKFQDVIQRGQEIESDSQFNEIIKNFKTPRGNDLPTPGM